jgi:hypothetical protein
MKISITHLYKIIVFFHIVIPTIDGQVDCGKLPRNPSRCLEGGLSAGVCWHQNGNPGARCTGASKSTVLDSVGSFKARRWFQCSTYLNLRLSHPQSKTPTGSATAPPGQSSASRTEATLPRSTPSPANARENMRSRYSTITRVAGGSAGTACFGAPMRFDAYSSCCAY